jgi:hypothetical protein
MAKGQSSQMTDGKPLRVIMRGAFLVGWTEAPQEEKDRVFKEYLEIHRRWVREYGVKFVASLDDEMMMVGSPGARLWNFYEIYEIPEFETLKKMMDSYRYPGTGRLRLDKYFRFEVVIGHPIGSLERALAEIQAPAG